MIEVLEPQTREEWLSQRLLGASELPALISAHPRLTPYKLWAVKTGLVPDDEENSAMRRGRLMEDDAVTMIEEDHPDLQLIPNVITKGGKVFRDVEAGISCTPDLFARDPEREGTGVIQIKNPEAGIFQRHWRNEAGEFSPPLYAIVQAIVEADLTGASWAAVAALVVSYGIDLHLVDVPLHPELMQRIRGEARDFWRMVNSGQRPPIDWNKDADLVAALYQPAQSGEVVDMSHSNELVMLADQREKMKADSNKLVEKLEANKTNILDRLNGAAAARLADGRLITVSRIHRKGYPVPPSTFLTLKVKDAP